MIEVDAGEDGAIGIDDVYRIQSTTKPHLKDHTLKCGLGKQEKRRERGELEIGQRNRGGPLARHLYTFKRIREDSVDDLDTIDADALIESQQVRRGIQPRAIAACAKHGFKHCAGRSLAIGTAHRDDRAGEPDAEAITHQRDPVQPHVDGFRMQHLDVREPIIQRGGSPGSGRYQDQIRRDASTRGPSRQIQAEHIPTPRIWCTPIHQFSTSRKRRLVPAFTDGRKISGFAPRPRAVPATRPAVERFSS